MAKDYVMCVAHVMNTFFRRRVTMLIALKQLDLERVIIFPKK